MHDALQLGLRVDDFWAMSPRAIVYLQRERLRQLGAAGQKSRRQESGGVRLSYLPRP